MRLARSRNSLNSRRGREISRGHATSCSLRCWFAPHDMPIGAKIIDAIDEAIRVRDKVLLMMGGLGRSWSGAEIRNVRW
jgi:hypothetical protein